MKVEETQKYQKKWHSHVERMPPECLTWQTYSYHPTGRRDIGRPRRRWRQQFLQPRNRSTDSILEWEEEEEEEAITLIG
jgi:hypothetical protein